MIGKEEMNILVKYLYRLLHNDAEIRMNKVNVLKEIELQKLKKQEELEMKMKMNKDEEVIIKQMKIQYTNRRFNYGMIEYEALKDLQIHGRRRMYKTEIRMQLLYGTEWTEIRNEIRIRFNNTCQECGRRFESHNLHVHHIKSISTFIEEGIGINDEEHECYGIKTNKPWHVETNLILLCQNHHAEEHPHMKQYHIEELKESKWTKKTKNQTYEQNKISKKEKDEMKLRIKMMFAN